MPEKILCPNCLQENDEWSDYCSFCGQILKKRRVEEQQQLVREKTSQELEVANNDFSPTKTIAIRQRTREEHPWWKPIKKKRRWYNPLEWFFWLGWSLYVIFRFLLVETLRYLRWCVCWAPPEELKKE